MFSSSDSNNRNHAGQQHSGSELMGRTNQYGNADDLSYDSSSHHKHNDNPSSLHFDSSDPSASTRGVANKYYDTSGSSAYDTHPSSSPFDSSDPSASTHGIANKYYDTSGSSAYDTRDNDPNRSSYNNMQTHAGSIGSSSLGSHNIDKVDPSSYGNRYTNPGTYGSGDRDTSYSSGNRDSGLDAAKMSAGTGVTSGPSVFPQGAYSAPEEYELDIKPQQEQGTDIDYNRSVKSDEYNNDKNKNKNAQHEDQSFASKMMGKVKYAMGVDDSKEHHCDCD